MSTSDDFHRENARVMKLAKELRDAMKALGSVVESLPPSELSDLRYDFGEGDLVREAEETAAWIAFPLTARTRPEPCMNYGEGLLKN